MEQFRDEYLEYSNVNHKKSTTETTEYAFNKLMKVTGYINLHKVDSSHFEKMKVLCNKPTTYNIYHNHLQSAFNRAIALKYLEHNPTEIVKKFKINKKIRRNATLDELRLLIQTVIKDKNDKYADFLKFAFITGCRRGELANLKWDKISIRDKYFDIVMPKGKEDIRMPLSDLAIEILLKRQDDPQPFDYLPNYMTKKTKKYIRMAGLSEELKLHCVRHSTTTTLLESGIDPFKVQKHLRHKDIKTTMDYEHSRPNFRKTSMDKISKIAEDNL